MITYNKLKPAPLLHDNWKHIDKRSLEEYRADDWKILITQKRQYLAERQADEVLRMLKIQATDPSYGYTVNIYQHCLQTATRMLQDNLPEEDIVVGLLHDVGYIVCPNAHGEFAALLLRPYISERNYWMLQHHEIFQQVHFHEYDDLDPNDREKLRGHPYFDWTEKFVADYDIVTINFDEEILPIEAFEPMVKRFFSQQTQPVNSL
jgi:predicted HD phosphohydrolase